MRYLFTQNATQGYRGKESATYYYFKAVQTLSGWVGVLEANDALADDLIKNNPQISEVDKKFHDEIIKKKERDTKPKQSSSTSHIRLNQTDTRPRKKRGCGVCGGRG